VAAIRCDSGRAPGTNRAARGNSRLHASLLGSSQPGDRDHGRRSPRGTATTGYATHKRRGHIPSPAASRAARTTHQPAFGRPVPSPPSRAGLLFFPSPTTAVIAHALLEPRSARSRKIALHIRRFDRARRGGTSNFMRSSRLPAANCAGGDINAERDLSAAHMRSVARRGGCNRCRRHARVPRSRPACDGVQLKTPGCVERSFETAPTLVGAARSRSPRSLATGKQKTRPGGW
jgi:hypothetical protein